MLPVRSGSIFLCGYWLSCNWRVYFILKELEKRGINIIYTPYENNELDYSFIKKQINNNRDIKLAVFTHASNVLGDVINLDLIGEILKTKNIPFFVDASHSLIHINI